MAGGFRRIVIEEMKNRPRLYKPARAARMLAGRMAPPRRVAGIPGRVHRNDFMMGHDPARSAEYGRVGCITRDLVLDAVTRGGLVVDDVAAWLDYGCGYGRVLRFLVQRVPAERVWAADVIPDAVRFCGREFGVHQVVATSDPTLMQFGDRRFDVIYAISVLTHVDEQRTKRILKTFVRSLSPGGVLVFSTHGWRSARGIAVYGGGKYVRRQPEIEADLEAGGMHFFPYGYYSDSSYGLAWHSPQFVRGVVADVSEGQATEVLFADGGLDGYQDLYAFRVRGNHP